MTACARHNFQYLVVGQQYLMSQGSPPRMKTAPLFSGEYPDVFSPRRYASHTATEVIHEVIDGDIGNRTRGALKQFQGHAGLPATGELDDTTLAQMVLRKDSALKVEIDRD
jgi:peptidoglycan hydrolase-like protein with peptidoglycan-binding domain